MAQLNSNITTTWDGLLGSEVQEAIRSQFADNITDINSGISNIAFSAYEENGQIVPGKVKYTITYIGGNKPDFNGVFSLVAASSYEVYLDRFDTSSEYVTPGSNLVVNYGFHIEDGGEQVGGKRATLQFTISNGSYSKTFNSFRTETSYKNNIRQGSYTIDSQYVKEGINTVTVALTFVDETGAVSIGQASAGVETSFTVLSFNLKLVATPSDNAKGVSNIIADPATTSITYDLVFKNGLGQTLTNDYGLSGKIKTRLVNSLGSVVNQVQTSSITTTLQNANGGSSGTHVYIFYLQSFIEFDETTVYSNVIKYQYIAGDLSSETSTRYAYTIPEYSNYSGANIDTSSNYQIAKQYSTIEFPVYAYLPTDKIFTYSVNDEKITDVEIAKPSETRLELVSGLRNESPAIPWSYTITEPESNIVTVSDGSLSIIFNITTQGIGADISMPSDPVLRLTANGKNGKDEQWGTTDGEDSLTSFNNFDWSSNGWLSNALVVNNNARAVIDVTPCYKTIGESSTSQITTGRSVSFRFKTSNENTEEELISCFNDNCDGFKIYPQKAVLYKGTQFIETKFSTEGSIKEITFVWYNSAYGNVSIIYVNGTSQMVLTSGTSTSNNAKVTITANETTLYLYNVEYYNKALNFNEVQSLYCLHKADDIANYATSNSIFNSNITLGNNGQKVTIASLPVGSTYLLIKAHPLGPSRFWEAINNLPATKNINGKDKETKSWRVLAGNTYLITKVAEGQEADSFNFFANRITFSGQGTSSMSYPIKNFRIYFAKKITPAVDTIDSDGEKVSGTGSQPGFGDAYDFTEGSTHWIDGEYGKTTVFVVGSEVVDHTYTSDNESGSKTYQMTSDAIPANVFCLKCDYAESSGMHNTGFARLANYAIENSTSIQAGESPKLPINAVKNDYAYTCRSTIDGKQIYLFFEDNDGNQVYGGKYNFNNEKSSPEVFGFQPYSSKLKYNSYINYQKTEECKGKAVKSYFDLDVVKNESALLKQLFGVQDDSYEKGHMIYKDSSGAIQINPTECWEFSTNDASAIKNRDLLGNYLSQIGAFTFPYTSENGHAVTGYPYSNTPAYANLNPFTEQYVKNGEDAGFAWINTEQAWEPRFPDDDDVNDFYEDGGTPYLLRSVYKWIHKHNVYCWANANKEEHAAIFARDLNKYFNVNYLIKYYVLTKLFINADQRIKNCMLAFYCDPNVASNADSDTPTGHMRGFYIFYDNDTILGVTNTGSLNNPWNAKETHDVFQGIDNNDVSYHGLWGNIEYCYNKYITNTTDNQYIRNLGKLVENAYREIRGKASDEVIKDYLNSHMPDSASNIDAEVKYFYPKTISPNASNWNAGNIEQYQGSRQYHREWLLDKRTKWFDAQYGAATINAYKINFKLEAANSTFTSKTIKIYSEFDDWKFYWQAGDAGDLIGTELLSKYNFNNETANNYGVITYNNNVNSNVCHIKGLYGANKIDMSGWYGTDSTNYMSTINNTADNYGYNALPYLKEFIIGSQLGNFFVAASGLQSLFIRSDEVLTPNLESLTIQNVTASTGGAFDLNFSQLIKLKTLNTTGTLANITLPNGGVLQSLTLKHPNTISFVDKVNLTSLTIEDIDVQNYVIPNIIINHSSDYLYRWGLAYLKSKGSAITNFTMTLGNGTDKDTLSAQTVSDLVEIARRISNGTLSTDNVHISGIGYYSAITKEQSSILYNAFGPNLVISSTSTNVYELDLDDGTVLHEGGTLKVYPTLQTDTDDGHPLYIINYVSGDNALYGKVSISNESSPYLCILQCGTNEDNLNKNCTITVTGTYQGEQVTSDPITVSCVAITSFTLTLPNDTNNIVGSGDHLVRINLNSGSTKQHLVDSQYIGQNITISTTSGSLVTTDIANGFTFTPTENQDAIITAEIWGIIGSVSVFYDVLVTNLVEGHATAEGLGWLDDIFSSKYYAFDNKIMRSDLSRFNISSTNQVTISGTIEGYPFSGNIAASEENTYDLTALAYFTPETTFTIPGYIKFSNLSIPQGVEAVQWTNMYQSYSGYGTITFPSTVTKVCINLSIETSSPNLKFDLSNNTNIKRIYNANVNSVSSMGNLNGVFSLRLNFEQSTTKYKNQVLFKYNKNLQDDGVDTACNIEQIGNYLETFGNDVTNSTVPLTMFNITEYGIADHADPLYSFGTITKAGLKLGAIASYYMESSPINLSATASYVQGLYYTFFRGNTGSSDGNFSSTLKFIGDGTFFTNTAMTTVSINGNVEQIGTAAFEQFGGLIQESASASAVNLSKVTVINNRAFNKLAYSHIFNIGQNDTTGQNNYTSVISLIGNYAFNSVTTGVNHTINIYTNTRITNIGATYPFGQSSNKNTINLYTTNPDVIDQFRTYANDAIINDVLNNTVIS